MKIKDIVENALKYNLTLINDNKIGYKFKGENSSFWNTLLTECYNYNPIIVKDYFKNNNPLK